MNPFFRSISLLCCGILLREWVEKSLIYESFLLTVNGWIHNLTRPGNEETSINTIEEFWAEWSSAIISSIFFLTLVLVLFPIIERFIETLEENKIEEQNTKRVSNLSIPKEIFDTMNCNERSFLSCLVTPKQIRSFRIGGLKNEIKTIKRSLLPIMECNLASKFNSELMQAPGGILLHGPPGCGKTLMAKALAKESGINFVNIKSSDIKCSLYGKTEAKITALFSFAQKIQPVIIFIDEIDSLLRSRGSESSNELSVTRGIKNLFMQHMDGVLNNGINKIVIVGATNRTEDIDPAILRRMRPQIYIGLPDTEQRKEIFQNILKNEPVDKEIDFLKLANKTPGFSGSEIRDICKAAALNILEEIVTASDNKKKADELQTNQKDEPLHVCSEIMNILIHEIEANQKRKPNHTPVWKKQSKNKHKTKAQIKVRHIRTEDILKVAAEWKNTENDKQQFEMYT